MVVIKGSWILDLQLAMQSVCCVLTVQIPLRQGVLNTALCDKVGQ